MRPIFFAALLTIALHAQDRRHVTEPVIPPACTTLTAASNDRAIDESKLDTQRIQAALDACHAGKAVVLKHTAHRNAFLSGPLQLRRGVTLVVAEGAILLGSRNPRDYDVRPGACGTVDETGHGCKPLIGGENVEGAGVMGDGIIDGRGGATLLGMNVTWWDLAEQARNGGSQNCPRILVLNRCDNFTVYRITIRNSPNFHVSYSGGKGFTVWGVKVFSPRRGARNTDGIDPGNSTNVTITQSFIHTGDDNVAIKAGPGAPTTNITVAHNHFYAGHGMSIGSNTDGGASSIRVTDLTIDGADNGIRIKSNSSRGGLVRDVVYKDVCIRNSPNPVYMDSNYSYRGTQRDRLPQFTGIELRNVRILGGGKITLDGFDAAHRLGISFNNVTADDPAALKIKANHAQVKLGPGAVNFRPQGEDVTVTGTPRDSVPTTCTGRFVDFPVK